MAVLADARLARSDPAAAERAVMHALDLAPDDVEASLAAYRFYFYNHRLLGASTSGDHRRADGAPPNIATDWHLVCRGDAAFSGTTRRRACICRRLLAGLVAACGSAP
ncbi:MAG: hypothetical protein R3D52_11410 [Xanthobacteraceae bacterium]